MQVHQKTSDLNIFHVTGRESGTSHSRNRSLDSPLSLFPDETHPVPHGTDTERPSTSSSGTYQSKFKEHMLTSSALSACSPCSHNSRTKPGHDRKLWKHLKRAQGPRPAGIPLYPPGDDAWGCEGWRWRAFIQSFVVFDPGKTQLTQQVRMKD